MSWRDIIAIIWRDWGLLLLTSIVAMIIIARRRLLSWSLPSKEISLRIPLSSMQFRLVTYQIKSTSSIILVCEARGYINRWGIRSDWITYLRWVRCLSICWYTIISCQCIIPFVLSSLSRTSDDRIHLRWLLTSISIRGIRVVKPISNGWKSIATDAINLLIKNLLVTTAWKRFITLSTYTASSVWSYWSLLLVQRAIRLVAVVH